MNAIAADGAFKLMWLLVAFPSFGALVLLLTGRRGDKWGHWLGVLMPLASFVVAAVLFLQMLGKPGSERTISQDLFTWIPAGSFHVEASFLLDPLSMTFVLLVTGVGTLIHLYSVGYMAHDPRRRRFFAYLNLFVAVMLILVLAGDYVLVYAGWEGVGLASYLLIGFWQERPSASTAAKKAFIANRVGDVGFSLAIMMMFTVFGATSFQAVFGMSEQASKGWVTAICLMLLLGACAKSAQFPLQTWLLDAMEGPTPVSALIHAATMVTAGVYLIARSHPLFNLSSDALLVTAIVGTITLLAGAIIGCGQDDIKKVLAGSTMSQIGYMILAVGLGPIGYAFAIGHLVVHGFFKANMFLGAGSVMHAMDDDVNMRHYGGLGRLMPVTTVTFLAGYLAILGFPWFGGFSTKDKIIEAAFDKGGTSGTVYGILAMLAAGITAFYMTRLVCMTFFGQKRWKDRVHPHESPVIMTIPLMILAVASVIGGFLLAKSIPTFLSSTLGTHEGHPRFNEVLMSVITLVVVLAGVAIGYAVFGRRTVPATPPAKVSVVTTASRHQLYGDAINEALLERPGVWGTRALVFVDNKGIDGLVGTIAATFGGLSSRLRRVQTGFVRSYALVMLIGATVLVGVIALVGLV